MNFAFKIGDKRTISNPQNICPGKIVCGYLEGPTYPNGKETMNVMYDISLFAISNFSKSVPRKILPEFPEKCEIDEFYCVNLETLLRLIMPSKREVFKKDGNLSKYGEQALDKTITFISVRLETIKDKLVKVVEAKDFATRLYNLVNMFELSKIDTTYEDRDRANAVLSYFDGNENNDEVIFALREGLPYYDITQKGMEAFKRFVLWILICMEMGFYELWNVDVFERFVDDIMKHD